MWLLDGLAEARIEAAVRKGEFNRLKGAGRPLDLDDDPLVPEEERAALRILKNAGLVPPEVEHMRERRHLKSLLAQLDVDSDVRRQALKRVQLLELRLRARGLELSLDEQYADRVLDRLSRTNKR